MTPMCSLFGDDSKNAGVSVRQTGRCCYLSLVTEVVLET